MGWALRGLRGVRLACRFLGKKGFCIQMQEPSRAACLPACPADLGLQAAASALICISSQPTFPPCRLQICQPLGRQGQGLKVNLSLYTYPTGLFLWRGQTNRGVLQGSGMDLKTVRKGRWKPRLQLVICHPGGGPWEAAGTQRLGVCQPWR